MKKSKDNEIYLTIDGLNTEQVEMLDLMWSIDGEDEFIEWLDSLDKTARRKADLLIELLKLSYLDSEVDTGNIDPVEYPGVANILDQFIKGQR